MYKEPNEPFFTLYSDTQSWEVVNYVNSMLKEVNSEYRFVDISAELEVDDYMIYVLKKE